MGKLFGTDGVRGIANEVLTPELAMKLGKAGAYVLAKESGKRPVFLIGMDTRLSGDMLENALTAGILAMGGDVIKVGVLPTPAVAYLVRYYEADAGIVISASHNTFEYNGIKFFNSRGYKLSDEIEDEIEAFIAESDGTRMQENLKGGDIGRCLYVEDSAVDIYADFLRKSISADISDMKIVLDLANGAATSVAEQVFKGLGADIVVIGDEPDGLNINDDCGSTHTENLQAAVISQKADLGLAFDGDADRLIAVDENGDVVDGDRTICICAGMLKARGELVGNRITATVMSNLGLHKEAEKMGCSVDITDVGDRYVLERMVETGCVLGGEQSGHIIFLNHTTTGDGMLSGLQLLQAVKESGKTLSRLAQEIEIYPQVLINAKIKNENKRLYKDDAEIVSAISAVEAKMAGEGRVLIRPSGTEPLVRVMIEGKDSDEIYALAQDIADLISRKFA